MLIVALLLGIGRLASGLRGAARRAGQQHICVGGAELIEGLNVGTVDGIDDGAGLDQGMGASTGDGLELAEVLGAVIGDGSGLDKGPADGAWLRDGPNDSIST